MLERARAEGLDVAADQYPYTAAATTLATILPPALLGLGVDACVAALADLEVRALVKAEIDRGTSGWEDIARDPGWGSIRISYAASHPDWSGRTLTELSDVVGLHPADVAFEALMDDRLDVSIVIDCMSEDDVEAIMAVPWISVCTDAEGRRPGHPILDAGKPHPRTYGSTARVLGTYVRDRGILPLEVAVAKLTSVPAARVGLRDRGVVREGARRRPRGLRPGDDRRRRDLRRARAPSRRHGPRGRQRWPGRRGRTGDGRADRPAAAARRVTSRDRDPRPSPTSPAARSTTRSDGRRGRAPCASSSTPTAGSSSRCPRAGGRAGAIRSATS